MCGQGSGIERWVWPSAGCPQCPSHSSGEGRGGGEWLIIMPSLYLVHMTMSTVCGQISVHQVSNSVPNRVPLASAEPRSVLVSAVPSRALAEPH